MERTHTIPLRREWLKSPRYRRAKRAVNAVKAFLKRHMKAEPENIKIGKYLNLEIWKHGIQNPPSKIRITAVKDDKGIVKAELVGAPKEEPKEEKKGKKTLEKKTEAAKAREKPAEKKPETKPVEKKEEVKKEEKKPVEKPKKEKKTKTPEKEPETKAPELRKEAPGRPVNEKTSKPEMPEKKEIKK